MTKLGRLVKDGKIKSLEEIYLFSLPIKVSFVFNSQMYESNANLNTVYIQLTAWPNG